VEGQPGREVNALLQRFADTPFGTFGFLDLGTVGGAGPERFCTGEDDWFENAPHVSCIPAGRYHCARSAYHGGRGTTFEVMGVPRRSRILFHGGATEEDTRGCILLGLDFGAFSVADEDAPGRPMRVKWGVTDSATAFRRFLERLEGVEAFLLEIVWAPPGTWRARRVA
jgi:hypothetical protein